LKSDCIYHAPIDCSNAPFGVPNQSENGKYNLISGLISERFFCVYALSARLPRDWQTPRYHNGVIFEEFQGVSLIQHPWLPRDESFFRLVQFFSNWIVHIMIILLCSKS